jgi:two-component system OmpR family sensor kinase
MNSIRARLTLSYALALGATLLIIGMVVWTTAVGAAARAQALRVAQVAELAARLVRGSAVADTMVIGVDSAAGGAAGTPGTPRQPALRARPLLANLPGYLVVADSARILYASPLVLALTEKDRSALTRQVLRFTPAEPAVRVQLDSVTLVLVAEFGAAGTGIPGFRAVAGESSSALTFLRWELFAPILIALPLLFVVALSAAWAAAGRALAPVDRLISDLEAIKDGRSLHRRLPVESEDNELDRLAQTINSMIARLEASFAALRRFTADASHELKTPLTVLRADIERAMQAQHVSYEQLPSLEEALAETARMANLVDSLLTLARADEGRYDIHREPVSLEPMVREVFETALILGEESGVAVALAVVEPLHVQGDPVRLRQLFLNLVTNALKYTPRDGTVTLALEQRGEQAAFSVHDTGHGIAAADLPFIFDRFWRADLARGRSSERGGFGLGLAISQWIAHAHGGAISVASRLGRGSTFTVTLPLPHPPAAPPTPA